MAPWSGAQSGNYWDWSVGAEASYKMLTFGVSYVDTDVRNSIANDVGSDSGLVFSVGASEFEQFLVGAWSDGRFLEFRVDGRLLGVAVTDRVERALSAVYTFYDPDESARGLGPFAILRQSAGERDAGLHHLYMGYCIEGHREKDDKSRFRPQEALNGRGWRVREPGENERQHGYHRAGWRGQTR